MGKSSKPSAIIAKLQANSIIDRTERLDQSEIFDDDANTADLIPTSIPMVNVALSGDLNGGISRGLHILAGKSKNFKSMYGLFLASSFLKHHQDGVVLFYDSEFGTPRSYFESFDIDTERVIRTPIGDIEDFKSDLINQLKSIDKDDHILILVDSIGNLASRKELDDALNNKTTTDMTRAKSLKSLFRLAIYPLNEKGIPMVAINHTYSELALYPREIVSGGTGLYYGANSIWIISRKQHKNQTSNTITGYDFTITIEKSRFVQEKKKIDIRVGTDGQIEKYSGLLNFALETKDVIMPSRGWYAKADNPNTKFRAKDVNSAQFWDPFLEDVDFQQKIRDNYQLQHIRI